MKKRNIAKIDNGQQGSVVREILNNTIDEVISVSQEVANVSEEVENTIPLTNLEIDSILSN